MTIFRKRPIFSFRFSENGNLLSVSFSRKKTYRITSLDRKTFLNIKENQTFISKTRFNLIKVVIFIKYYLKLYKIIILSYKFQVLTLLFLLLSFNRYFHMQFSIPILTNCKCHIYKEISFIYEMGKAERQRGILAHILPSKHTKFYS